VIGLLIAVYDFAELGAKPVFGFVADRRGTKTTMLAGIAVFSIASLSFLVLPPRLLLLVRLLQGLGAAALSITSAAWSPTISRRPGSRLRIYNAIKGAGYVLSPVLGGAIVWASRFSMIFVACFVVGAIAFVSCLAFPRPARTRARRRRRGLLLESVPRRGAGPTTSALVRDHRREHVPGRNPLWLLPVYVHSLGYDQLRNGLIVASATTSYLLVQPVAGMLADRFDAKKVMGAGSCCPPSASFWCRSRQA